MQAQRPGDVLIAESDRGFGAAMKKVLEGAGHHVCLVTAPEDALRELERHGADALLSGLHLCDAKGAPHSGVDLCHAVKSRADSEGVPVALIVEETGEGAILTGALASDTWDAGRPGTTPRLPPDDLLLRPFSGEELLVRVSALLRARRYREEVGNAVGALMRVAEGVEEQDSRASGHCKRLSLMAVELGAALGCDDWQLTTLERAGYLHDIGKVCVPGALLEKTAPLSPREVQIMQGHCAYGERMCAPVAALRGVLPIIRHHHERGDGTGYPDGLRLENIPVLAQVFAVPDIYDAMRTWRPYRPALTSGQAVGVLRQEVDRGFWNSAIFEAFCDRVLPNLDARLEAAGALWPKE